MEVVPLDRHKPERLIGEFCPSINDITPGGPQNQLVALCDRLEAAERDGDGGLEEF